MLPLKIRISVTIRGQVREYLLLYGVFGDVSDVKKSMSVGVLVEIHTLSKLISHPLTTCDHTRRKAKKNKSEDVFLFVCTILFEVIWAFGNMQVVLPRVGSTPIEPAATAVLAAEFAKPSSLKRRSNCRLKKQRREQPVMEASAPDTSFP